MTYLKAEEGQNVITIVTLFLVFSTGILRTRDRLQITNVNMCFAMAGGEEQIS